jgi:hypothetical protein
MDRWALDDQRAELLIELDDLEREHQRLQENPRDGPSHRMHLERLREFRAKLAEYRRRLES